VISNFGWPERFSEDPGRSAILQCILRVCAGAPRHETGDNIGIKSLESFQCVRAVQTWQLYVEKHQIDLVTMPPVQVDSIVTIHRQPDIEAAALQLEFEQGQDQRHVIGNEYTGIAHRCFAR
jgi:hypothetical protein